MACLVRAEVALLRCALLFLYVSVCLCQLDCTGVDCPLLDNCIEEALESGSCCTSCLQKGCTCEGYQYYDCVNAGFKNGKVPEGDSYFVDYGSTECSCPAGGGRIMCHFISCPEMPPNCIDISEPADGCMQCERIGCSHSGQKYEAGHSFHVDPCRVCHCPNEGGELICYPVPDCDPKEDHKPMLAETTEEDTGSRRDVHPYKYDQQGHTDQLSTPYHLLPNGNLPLFKPSTFGKEEPEDYDYGPTDLPETYPQSLAFPTQLFSSDKVIPMSEGSDTPERPSFIPSFDRPNKLELRERYGVHDHPAYKEEVTDDHLGEPQSTVRPHMYEDTTTSWQPSQGQTQHKRRKAMKSLRAATRPAGTRRLHPSPAPSPPWGPEYHTTPMARYLTSTTTQLPVGVSLNESSEPGQRLFDLHSEDVEEVKEGEEEEEGKNDRPVLLNIPDEGPGASAEELLQSCCAAGQRWFAENLHCNLMPLLTNDKHSVCSVVQNHCCLSSVKESQCDTGMTSARRGDTCEVDQEDQCSDDSFQVCCSCCALGLRVRGEGRGCDAHQYLSYPCGHVFLTCCEEEEGPSQMPLKRKQKPRPTPMPKKVSDSKYPKEAYSISTTDEAANVVNEQEDVDECQLYAGQLCQHKCTNMWGSYLCDCHQGYILQKDRHSCAPVSPDEDNRVREDRPSVVQTQTTTTSTTTSSPVRLNPCTENGPCSQQCTAVAGQAHCSCFPGFSLMTDGHMCEDVDECVTNTHSCRPSERCVNTVGSFVCELQVTCPAGYQLRNGVCEDIDECVQRTHNCGTGFVCDNTVGSFLCNAKHKCISGFTQDSHGNCIDINECKSLSEPCSSGSNCINTVGSFTCQQKIIMCSHGYHASPDGAKCV
ncbi:unnamed protein product, partial [Pleuronectes platessa]